MAPKQKQAQEEEEEPHYPTQSSEDRQQGRETSRKDRWVITHINAEMHSTILDSH